MNEVKYTVELNWEEMAALQRALRFAKKKYAELSHRDKNGPWDDDYDKADDLYNKLKESKLDYMKP